MVRSEQNTEDGSVHESLDSIKSLNVTMSECIEGQSKTMETIKKSLEENRNWHDSENQTISEEQGGSNPENETGAAYLTNRKELPIDLMVLPVNI